MTSDPRLRVPLVIVTALVIHLSVLSRLRVAGVMPDLMLLLAVAGGITGGSVQGAVIGFVSGMTVDFFLETPLGLSGLVFSVTGYCVGVAQTGILRSAWWIPMLTAFVASAAGQLLFAVAGAVVGATPIDTGHLLVVLLVVGVTNALLAPLALRLVGWSLARQARPGVYVA
ncbi:MAG TPA: rod shape-determining protein MreD [Acidimicrobiales bacterium]|nr:rod shape-determining protein MreD [Acidimicrobiales bacterium]